MLPRVKLLLIERAMTRTIKAAQFGLGPIGLETLKLAAQKPWIEIVGAIDIDPAKIGKDLGDLTGVQKLRGQKVVSTLPALLESQKPDVIFHTTVSKFQPAFDQLLPMAKLGISVVSSCEELLFPPLRGPELAKQLDAECKKSGARIVGTGVNPGFVMDVLPLCVTGVSREVRSIRIDRVVNASTRREPLQRKIGSGIAPAEFQQMLDSARAGHAGLKDSLALIAHVLGWNITGLVETAKPVVADHEIQTRYFHVRPGQTCGISQRAEARRDGKVCLSLDLQMYLDAKDPRDEITVEGDPPLHVIVAGGVAGDQATVAALVNTAARILNAPPGLLLMTDLSLPHAA